jgi:hypothetical protein
MDPRFTLSAYARAVKRRAKLSAKPSAGVRSST